MILNFWLLLTSVGSQSNVCNPISDPQALLGISKQRRLLSPTIEYIPSGIFPGAAVVIGWGCVLPLAQSTSRKDNANSVVNHFFNVEPPRVDVGVVYHLTEPETIWSAVSLVLKVDKTDGTEPVAAEAV